MLEVYVRELLELIKQIENNKTNIRELQKLMFAYEKKVEALKIPVLNCFNKMSDDEIKELARTLCQNGYSFNEDSNSLRSEIRSFFFDNELLKHYEELLFPDSFPFSIKDENGKAVITIGEGYSNEKNSVAISNEMLSALGLNVFRYLKGRISLEVLSAIDADAFINWGNRRYRSYSVDNINRFIRTLSLYKGMSYEYIQNATPIKNMLFNEQFEYKGIINDIEKESGDIQFIQNLDDIKKRIIKMYCATFEIDEESFEQSVAESEEITAIFDQIPSDIKENSARVEQFFKLANQSAAIDLSHLEEEKVYACSREETTKLRVEHITRADIGLKLQDVLAADSLEEMKKRIKKLRAYDGEEKFFDRITNYLSNIISKEEFIQGTSKKILVSLNYNFINSGYDTFLVDEIKRESATTAPDWYGILTTNLERIKSMIESIMADWVNADKLIEIIKSLSDNNQKTKSTQELYFDNKNLQNSFGISNIGAVAEYLSILKQPDSIEEELLNSGEEPLQGGMKL